MKKPIYILLISFFLTSCFLDPQPKTRNVIKDFNLGWYYDSRDQALFRNSDTTQYGGSTVIPETVYAVGFDDNFIIAKRHPNKQDSIGDRLFRYNKNHKDYLLDDPKDTIWLSKDDSIYQENGQWYHISNGWNPPDSLYPYRNETFYYIIDIRNYDSKKWNNKKNVFEFTKEADFLAKKGELEIPESLTFTLIYKELE